MPVPVANLRGVRTLRLGLHHACAVVDDGHVACWGQNRFGQTGNDTSYLEDARDVVEAKIVPDVDHVVDVALTSDATCALAATSFCAIKDEHVICWGRTSALATTSSPLELTTIPVDRPRRVRLGPSQGCVVDADGAVWCFGENLNGNLGAPPIEGRWSAWEPTKVEGLPSVADVVCSDEMSCAITTVNEVWCWGRFFSGSVLIHRPTRISI